MGVPPVLRCLEAKRDKRDERDLLKRLDFIAADEEDKLQLELESLIGLITFKMRALADAGKADSNRVREHSSLYGIDEHELGDFED